MISSLTNPVYTGLEALTFVLITVQLFWNVTPCRLVNNYRHFEGYHSIHCQVQTIRGKELMSVNIYKSTRYKISEKPSIVNELQNVPEQICGNKMPTTCNRGFYCRSYCLFNMFRAPLCPSSGAQEYYTVVVACGTSCCGFQVAGLVWS